VQDIVYQELVALLILSDAKPCSPGCVREGRGDVLSDVPRRSVANTSRF
jgi:hypothetical protein